MNFRTLKLRKNPDCPVCGTNPTVTELIDYDQFCGIAKPTSVGPLEVARDKAVADAAIVEGIPQITVEQLKQSSTTRKTSSSSTSASPTSTPSRTSAPR